MTTTRARAGLILAAAVALLSIGAAAQPSPERYVREIRFWTLEEATRVAVETSHEVEYRWERIGNPDRLFFDLQGMRPRPGLRGVQTIPVSDRLLKQIRMAETQRGVTRVVLDLAAPVDCTVSQLTNPDRLIIELRPAKPALAPPAVTPSKPERLTEPSPPVPLEPAPPPASVAKTAPTEPKPAVSSVAKPAPTEPKPAVSNVAKPAPASPKEPVGSAAAKPAPAEPKVPVSSATAAQRDSRGDRSLIRALGLKIGSVVLDPGHGGHDTGSIGPGGLVEKELVLDVAQRLGALITDRLGSQVLYTRAEDAFVPLEARTALANEHKADLFISLHANSSRLRGIAGSETYYLNFTTSASALEVAARENATSEKTIHELQELVQKITLKTKVQESREFAAALQKSLFASLFKGKPPVKDRGVKKAPFVVLIGAAMPSVLVEMDFLTNSRSEKLLKTPDYRQRVAEALFKGVAQYASSLSHFQVAQSKSGP